VSPAARAAAATRLPVRPVAPVTSTVVPAAPAGPAAVFVVSCSLCVMPPLNSGAPPGNIADPLTAIRVRLGSVPWTHWGDSSKGRGHAGPS
jgi:hypothetical protein